MHAVRKYTIEMSIVLSAGTRPDDVIENLGEALRLLQQSGQVEDWHVMDIETIDEWGARLNDGECF